MTWLTTSVTAETNSKAATRTVTANDNRGTANPVAAWKTRAASSLVKTRNRSRNRLGSTRGRRHEPPAAVFLGPSEAALVTKNELTKFANTAYAGTKARCLQNLAKGLKFERGTLRMRDHADRRSRGTEFALFRPTGDP